MSPKGCRFPEWLNEMSWRDASGKLHVQGDKEKQELLIKHRRPTSGGYVREEVVSLHRCKRLLSRVLQNDNTEVLTYQTFSTNEWWAVFLVVDS